MKNIRRKCLMFAVACFMSQVAICDEAVSNAVAAVDVQLASCVSALPNGDRGCPTYMMEFGMPDGMMASETELGLFVSNHIEVVYSNFSAIATTKVEKMLLLASAWRLGDDYYLNCLSRNVDLATSGDIAADDLQWFMKGHRTRRLSYILADRYDSPGVSNIVQRLIAYTGETNKYEKVLSGQAKIEHAEFEQFLADGPESPRQNQ